MTVLEAIVWGTNELKRAWAGQYFSATANASLDTQVILSYLLRRPSAFLFAHGEYQLLTEQKMQFENFIARRARREPVAYIIGEKAFWKGDFLVDKSTLIPRPDTEVMVERALKFCSPETVVVDVGTGSGAIAISIAIECPNTPVLACDVSKEALVVAKKNADRNGAGLNLEFAEGDLFKSAFGWLAEFNRRPGRLIITANLPYLTVEQWEALDPDVRDYEPKSALVAQNGGLEYYETLIESLAAKRQRLPAQIILLMEIDPSQKERLTKLCQTTAYAKVSILPGLNGQDRFVMAEF